MANGMPGNATDVAAAVCALHAQEEERCATLPGLSHVQRTGQTLNAEACMLDPQGTQLTGMHTAHFPAVVRPSPALPLHFQPNLIDAPC